MNQQKPRKILFKHTGHCHDLILYNVAQIYSLRDRIEFTSYPFKFIRCGWCTKPVSSGKCYGCVDCGVYLHHDCTFKAPFEIRNPLKQSGRTTLCIEGDKGIWSKKSSTFCSACSHEVTPFDIVYSGGSELSVVSRFHGICVLVLIPSLKSEHHSEHHLTYFDNARRLQLYCDKCGSYGRDKFNGFYGCIECNKNFHLSCILEDTVMHKYHRHPLSLLNPSTEEEGSDDDQLYCDICETKRHPSDCVYSCKEQCGYCTAHIECAISQERQQLLILRLNKPLNEILKFLMVKSGSKSAVGANEKKTTKEGLQISWPLDPSRDRPHSDHHHVLIFKSTSRREFICDVCGKLSPSSSANYKCQECSFIIDVKCAKFSSGVRRFKKSELRHFCHHHKLHLLILQDTDIQGYCDYCCYDLVGFCYYCFHCGFSLHKSCLEQVPRKISLPRFSPHSFVFKKGLMSRCLACGSSDDCFYYGSEHGDKFVHSVCALSLKRPLIYHTDTDDDDDDHKHMLYYFGKDANLVIQLVYRKCLWFECRKCGECCLEAFYRCVACGVNFHLNCVPIPHVVKTPYHRHNVKLVDSFLVQGYDLEDQYCDVCEEKRDPRHHVYHCEECTVFFVAHIDCILSKKVEEIKEVEQSSSNPNSSDLLFNYQKVFGEQALGFKVEEDFVHKSYNKITFADFHPTKPWILLVSGLNSVEIWNFQTQTSQWKSSWEWNSVTTLNIVSARFIMHENWIVFGAYSGSISVHDEQRLLKHKFTAHKEGLCYIVVHPNPTYRLLFSFSKIDGLIKVWEMEEEWLCVMELRGHHPDPSFIQSHSWHPQLQLAFNPKDPDVFASGSNDDYLMIWKVCVSCPIHAFRADSKRNGITSLEFFMVGDELYLLGGLGDGKVKVWDYETRSCIKQFDCGGGLVATSIHLKHPIIVSASPSSLVVFLMNAADSRFSYEYKRQAEHGFYIGDVLSVACRRKSEFILLVCSQGVLGFKITHLEDPSKPEIQFASKDFSSSRKTQLSNQSRFGFAELFKKWLGG